MRLRFTVALAGTLFVAGGLTLRGARAEKTPATGTAPAGLAKATFAGGCFWCMEPPFEKLPGVLSVVSGYTGGRVPGPSYEQVSSGGTGHTEAVEVVYDPAKLGYQKLLEVFWKNVDPTVANRQFCDAGEQYRTGIFTHGEEQARLAAESKRQVERTKTFSAPVLTPIAPAGPFYQAEEYHQDYYKKNPARYRFYRLNCGRDARLTDLWGEAPH